MATVFGVSRSGFYYWINNRHKVTQCNEHRKQLDGKVREVFADKKERDGARRIQKELEKNGNKHDVRTVAASMKRQGLVAKAARKFKCTTDSKHRLPVAPNLLEQNFNATAPNPKWAGDITYLATSEGWIYLAVVIGLYSRQVVGWSMSTRMTATLVCDALSMALFRRGIPEEVVIHSDRGSQYCSKYSRYLIAAHNLKQSMSRKGHCRDGTFFSFFKIRAFKRIKLYQSSVNRNGGRELHSFLQL